jgi:hypothetical protein
MRSEAAWTVCAVQSECQKNWQEGGIYVVGVSLNESQVVDLTAHFYTNTFDEAREAIFQEAIKAAKEEAESLI